MFIVPGVPLMPGGPWVIVGCPEPVGGVVVVVVPGVAVVPGVPGVPVCVPVIPGDVVVVPGCVPV